MESADRGATTTHPEGARATTHVHHTAAKATVHAAEATTHVHAATATTHVHTAATTTTASAKRKRFVGGHTQDCDSDASQQCESSG
jgi:hypothetical protein